jgi:hypothetical protein
MFAYQHLNDEETRCPLVLHIVLQYWRGLEGNNQRKEKDKKKAMYM